MPIRGCQLIEMEKHGDKRGDLSVLELLKIAGFSAPRLFLIQIGPEHENAVRAEHSSTSAEVLVAVNGKLDVDLDNGSQRACVTLNKPDTALLIHPGVWLRLKSFEVGTTLLVAASLPFSKTAQHDLPRPDLIDTLRAPAHD